MFSAYRAAHTMSYLSGTQNTLSSSNPSVSQKRHVLYLRPDRTSLFNEGNFEHFLC